MPNSASMCRPPTATFDSAASFCQCNANAVLLLVEQGESPIETAPVNRSITTVFAFTSRPFGVSTNCDGVSLSDAARTSDIVDRVGLVERIASLQTVMKMCNICDDVHLYAKRETRRKITRTIQAIATRCIITNGLM